MTMETSNTVLGRIDPDLADNLVSRRGLFTGAAASLGALASAPMVLATASQEAFGQGKLPQQIVDVLVFALTLEPQFFEALGYQRVDRARYPEKIRRDCIACARRFACNETCFAKALRERGQEGLAAAA